MFRLGLRLALGGGREAYARLITIAGGVMIGVALLLFSIAGLNVLYGTSQKACWQCSVTQFREEGAEDLTRNDVLLWRYDTDSYRGESIYRHDIAVKGTVDQVIPGISRMPGQNEYYVSPALARLIAAVPANKLGDRFPGTMLGEIGRAGLTAPDALIAIVGHTPDELVKARDVLAIAHINRSPQPRDMGPLITALFVMGVAGLLFAVYTLIATSTRLSAARREEKFAILRLAGATPEQINRFAAIDALLSAGVGALAGIGLFYALRSSLAAVISNDFVAFFPEDLTPGTVGSLAVLLGTPCLATSAAVLSLRHVQASPLGVSRRVTPKAPRVWRIIPLLAGLAIVAAVWLHNRNIIKTETRAETLPYFLLGFGMLLVGLVIAGPWLTMAVTQLLARRAGGASALLATRRLADNPRAAFRPVSVMVTALFICTIIAGMTPLVLHVANSGKKEVDHLFTSQHFAGRHFGDEGRPLPMEKVQELRAKLQQVPGVYTVPTLIPKDQSVETGITHVLVRCEDMARLKIFGECPPDATAMRLDVGFDFNFIMNGMPTTPPDSLNIPAAALQRLSLNNLIILTDGQPHHIEQLRTVMAQDIAFFRSGTTWAEDTAARTKRVESAQLIINGALFVVLFVAGCSLAVAAGGSVIERKRPFGLLRVAGMSQNQLARVLLYESVVPLLSSALLAIGMGFFVVHMLIISVLDKGTTLPSLGAGYVVVVGGGLLVATLVLLSVLPILKATTRPAGVRFE